MSGLYVVYPSTGGGGGSGGLSSISFSIGTMDAGTINQNGASVSSNSIFLQSATVTFPGLVNSSSQTFSGVKTFNSPPNFSSLTPSAFLKLDGSGNVTVGSISLTNDVTGNLPLSQTQGSLSLTTQVVGVLPPANLPPLSSISGSVSLTSQVSGLLPQSNIGSLSAAYNVGAFDGATASVNGGVIGTSSLFFQSASTTNPGLMNTSTTQSFTGIKSFTQLGVNNTSGTAGLFVVSSGLATNSLTIQSLSGQTSLGLNIINSAGTPAVVYDFNAGAFRLFVPAQETAECNFDNRANVVTASINSGSAARFNFVCGQTSAVTAGNGGGIAFAATVTGTTTITEFAYIWGTKNNSSAGDDDGSMHFATRSNATGKAQRVLDMDQTGKSQFYGNVAMAGSLNGAITHSAGSSVAAYTVVWPSAQGSSSSTVLNNDGAGNLVWKQSTPTKQIFTALGSNSYFTPANCRFIKVTVVGGGGGGGGTASTAAAAGAAGGGGGGAMAIKWFTPTPLQVFSLIIGTGGPGGASGNNVGIAGSQSVFSTTTASGGSGGGGSSGAFTTAGISGAGGSGGNNPTNFDVSGIGVSGNFGFIFAAGTALGGRGGGSPSLGGGASEGGTGGTTAAGQNATANTGGGGSGAVEVSNGGAGAGGNGGSGIIICEEFY